MITWDQIIYDVSNAQRDFDKLEVLVDKVEPIEPMKDLLLVRDKLINIRNKVFEEHGFETMNKLDYKFDLAFGIELYEYLNDEIDFTNRIATYNDIWRYLSVRVVPDIVHARWGLNAERYFKNTRRIWLKAIWWYIHLSWQGDKLSTYEILKTNTTDTVVQLVERPGIGYHVEVYRELMLQYNDYEDRSRELFRTLLKINTARLLTTSPELVEGGIVGYVKSLFEAALREESS